MNATSPAATVLEEAATWAGITTRVTPRGATAIVYKDNELGHVHADRNTLDLPLPADRRAQGLEAGRAKEWFSNWVTKQLASRADAETASNCCAKATTRCGCRLHPPQGTRQEDRRSFGLSVQCGVLLLGMWLLEVVALLEILDRSGCDGSQPSRSRVTVLEAGASRKSASQVKWLAASLPP